ncbi:hypothetical protein M407DRAFT_94446 [Tulasnella calospora MUT 4182]|uniref:NYN domain-containing protein n=1 Tax=Tulasnella calospora MUT 4182 TaxID=1051891 RepID=A0A0C3QH70_9AGAM|nr:hypothetical protein M407DRAFT_94446 [Tulasnella calospora MUT 4182]
MKLSLFRNQFRGATAAVLWDFQNSAVRRGTIKPAIETMTKPLETICPVQTVNAYIQTSGKFNSSGLSQEFRNTKAQLIKCPFSEDKGCTSDKTIIETIETLKLKAPAGQRLVFVLVSGDGGFAACTARLREAGHAVVLVLKPNTAGSCLGSQTEHGMQ